MEHYETGACTMHKIFIPALLILITATPVFADGPKKNFKKRFELTALGGVQVGGFFDFENGEAQLDPGGIVGGTLGFYVHGTGRLVASYNYQFTSVEISSTFAGGRSDNVDAGVGHLQFGGEIDFPVRLKVLPFVGMTIGAMHIKADTNDAKTDWFFSSALYGGVKVPFTSHIGLRAQAKVIMIVPSGSSSSFCIEGHGCHVSIYVDTVWQGEFAGGLYVTF
jgi:hypothetical protein